MNDFKLWGTRGGGLVISDTKTPESTYPLPFTV